VLLVGESLLVSGGGGPVFVYIRNLAQHVWVNWMVGGIYRDAPILDFGETQVLVYPVDCCRLRMIDGCISWLLTDTWMLDLQLTLYLGVAMGIRLLTVTSGELTAFSSISIDTAAEKKISSILGQASIKWQ
jgi:hypothetical protein